MGGLMSRRMDEMSESSRRQLETQMQIRNNAKDLSNMWAELNTWEDEIKSKDRKLRSGEEADDSKGFYDLLDDDGDLLTDVNPEVLKEEELSEHAKNVSKKFVEQNAEALAQKKMDEERIKPKTYQEYNKWDAFDVDEELKKMDEKERKANLEKAKKEQLDRRQKDAERRRRKKDKKEDAKDMKEEGNEAFKKGDYEEALDCYTLSLAADPAFQTYCNRAMVLLKMHRPADAEADADKAIRLNPKFTKAYMRRGAAREDQEKFQEALEDYLHAKTLEPLNKETRKMVKRVQCKLGLAEEEEEDKESVDPYTVMAVETVEYGSDSDYEDSSEPSAAVVVEEKSTEVDSAVQAREMPAHLKK